MQWIAESNMRPRPGNVMGRRNPKREGRNPGTWSGPGSARPRQQSLSGVEHLRDDVSRLGHLIG